MDIPRDMLFTLRQLRTAKGCKQKDVAQMLMVTPAQYNFIEQGKRRPSIDQLHALAALYGTSMDFVYHAYYMRSVEYHFPEASLAYGLKMAKEADMEYLRDNAPLSER